MGQHLRGCKRIPCTSWVSSDLYLFLFKNRISRLEKASGFDRRIARAFFLSVKPILEQEEVYHAIALDESSVMARRIISLHSLIQ